MAPSQDATALNAPAVLLLRRQIVVGQEDGKLLALGRRVDIRPNEMPGRQRQTAVSQQRSQAAPVESARFAVHSDGHHRIAIVRVLHDLINDHDEQQAMPARWR